jgi:hydrogenase maturation protease
MKLLVIGYGNTLRSDDGVGPRIAEAIERMHLPGVETLVSQQLSPEHAEAISRAENVIFVDAAISTADIQIRRLEPVESSQLLAHSANPHTVLALARNVYGRTPAAWCVTIPALNLGFGERLSELAEHGCAEAVEQILKLHRRLCRIDRPEPVVQH